MNNRVAEAKAVRSRARYAKRNQLLLYTLAPPEKHFMRSSTKWSLTVFLMDMTNIYMVTTKNKRKIYIVKLYQSNWLGSSGLAIQYWKFYRIVNEKNISMAKITYGVDLRCTFRRTVDDRLFEQGFLNSFYYQIF